jgi:acetylglutamate kinase
MNPSVLDTLDYVRKFSGHRLAIKLGGSVLEDPTVLRNVCQDILRVRSVGIQVFIVHGGGPAINQELTKSGISWEFLDGLRVTTPAMMEVIERTLVGGVNRRIVRALQEAGLTACGVSGSDFGLLHCVPESEAHGLVGRIVDVNGAWLEKILASQTGQELGVIPVIAPIGGGKDGRPYNVNADWVGAKIAVALKAKKLLFLTDQEGVLDESKALLPELDAADLQALMARETVTGGMLTKVRSVLEALKGGVLDVHILNARRPYAMVEELFTSHGIGTICRARSRRKRDVGSETQNTF